MLGGNATVLWNYNGIAQNPFSFCIQSYNPSSIDLNAALDAGLLVQTVRSQPSV